MPADSTTFEAEKLRARAIRASDRYLEGDKLGRGGMGEVVAARDLHLARDVAIKRLHPALLSTSMLERFVQEARIQAMLDHPAIVPVHELDEDAEGSPYLVMKRLRGVTFSDAIAGHGSEPITLHRLLAAFAQVCLAIEFAHQRGVIHRDLKPANLMLGHWGEVYVLDWGVAKVVNEVDRPSTTELAPASRASGLTVDGGIIGTPSYMAPAQLAGEAAEIRSDVYSLGCILFELLARRPLHAGWPEPLADEQRRPSLYTDHVPPELDDVCVRATDPDPERRYATARELHDAIESYLAGDRDLVRRRALADGHVAAAEAALVATDGSESTRRVKALREAGRALAIAPDHPKAAPLLARLLLTAPNEIPPEVAAELDRSQDRRNRMFVRIGIGVYLAFAGFLPIVAWMGIRDDGLVVAFAVSLLVSIVLALPFSNRPVPRWPIFVTLAIASLQIALVSRLFGGWLFSIPLALAWACAHFVHPARIPVRWTVGMLAGATIVFPLLELLELASPTTRFVDGTLVVAAGVTFTPVAFTVASAAMTLGGMLMLALLLVRTRRAMEADEAKLALQRWQLRQTIATIDELEPTGVSATPARADR